MNIHNIEGLSGEELRNLVNQGGKFVQYKTCISIVVMTFNNPTDIYFIGPGESRYTPGITSFLLTLLLGWWGIPWGPIYTIGNLVTFAQGGKDLTAAVMSEINQNDPTYGTGGYGVAPSNDSNTSNSGYNIPR
jgi:hypothetical protein